MFSTDVKSSNVFLYTSHQNLVSNDPANTSLRVAYFQTTTHTSTETLTSFTSVVNNTGTSSTISYTHSKTPLPTASSMLSQYLRNATSSFDVKTSASGCLCDCKGLSSTVSILSTAPTSIDQSIVLLSLVKDMTVEKKETSAYIRKHVSADDKRQSAKAIGSIGIAIILIVFGVIISFDIPHFYKIMRPMLRCF
ncbi:hypothetical protein ACJMK2_005574 [Sinanodonta woodiana]|uniref:Uncharacterized protein n=1 Tax=Sinanodonta woodiana TaxID=1069815 RepID=A0ABD3VRT2_SINWO